MKIDSLTYKVIKTSYTYYDTGYCTHSYIMGVSAVPQETTITSLTKVYSHSSCHQRVVNDMMVAHIVGI